MEALIAWFGEIHWVAVLQIILIDILLGGDNAVVIALACRSLDPHLRVKALFTAPAALFCCRHFDCFRSLGDEYSVPEVLRRLAAFVDRIKLIAPADEGEHEIHASKRLWGAVKTIIVADLIMSIDNVIAIAGAAEQAPGHHQMALVIFGLLVSVPFILGGSQIILKIIDRFPIIVYAGGALLGWIAGTLMVDDPGILAHLPNMPALHTEGGIAGAIFVLIVAFILKYFRSKKTKA